MHKQATKSVHIVLRPLQPRFDAKFSNYTSHTLGRRWFNINPFLPQNNTVRTYAIVMHKAKKKGSVRCTRSQVPSLISNCISHEFSKRYSQHQSCSQHLLLSDRGFWTLRKPRRSGNMNAKFVHLSNRSEATTNQIRSSKTSKFMRASLRCMLTRSCGHIGLQAAVGADHGAGGEESNEVLPPIASGECTQQQYPQQYWLITPQKHHHPTTAKGTPPQATYRQGAVIR